MDVAHSVQQSGWSMKWIDRRTPKWANEGKQLIKVWQKERTEQKNRDKQDTKQIKLDLNS